MTFDWDVPIEGLINHMLGEYDFSDEKLKDSLGILLPGIGRLKQPQILELKKMKVNNTKLMPK